MILDDVLLLKVQDKDIDTLLQLIEIYADDFIAVIQVTLREEL